MRVLTFPPVDTGQPINISFRVAPDPVETPRAQAPGIALPEAGTAVIRPSGISPFRASRWRSSFRRGRRAPAPPLVAITVTDDAMVIATGLPRGLSVCYARQRDYTRLGAGP